MSLPSTPHVHGPVPGQGRAGAALSAYWLAIALTGGYALVELIGGRLTGSLALMSDAGHMFFDAAALALAAVASIIAGRPATARHSFGFARAEVLGAALNGVMMLVVIALIVSEALHRLAHPQPIHAGWAITIAMIGLLVNLAVIALLSRNEQTLNMRGALLHVIGDLLGSAAAVAAGVLVWLTDWTAADAWLSLVIAGLILVATIRLLARTVHVLLEGVPEWIDLAELRAALIAVPGVREVPQLRVWTVSSGHAAVAAHLELDDPDGWPEVLAQATALLKDRFAIGTVTLQPELGQRQAVSPAVSDEPGGVH